MKISILTLFPEMFKGPFAHSILKRAKEKNLIEINYVNIRNFGIGKHHAVDDTPYGGGAGMLMQVDVVEQAIAKTKCSEKPCKEHVLLMDAAGETFTQKKAQTLTSYDHLIFICGHYEGIDYRIHEYVDEAISIGNYVLTGGEIPAMVITDAVARLLPGVLGNDTSSRKESFQSDNLLEYPQYTKPLTFKNSTVPEILLGGNHKKIAEWRQAQAVKRTLLSKR